ncbi:hypothetical protein B0H14DRAFT_2575248 [Mycena olivaceomarginata]|nr:hypothetical protein B0H14DRAFT_2575248 [Mycena olivaceomarginata]
MWVHSDLAPAGILPRRRSNTVMEFDVEKRDGTCFGKRSGTAYPLALFGLMVMMLIPASAKSIPSDAVVLQPRKANGTSTGSNNPRDLEGNKGKRPQELIPEEFGGSCETGAIRRLKKGEGLMEMVKKGTRFCLVPSLSPLPAPGRQRPTVPAEPPKRPQRLLTAEEQQKWNDLTKEFGRVLSEGKLVNEGGEAGEEEMAEDGPEREVRENAEEERERAWASVMSQVWEAMSEPEQREWHAEERREEELLMRREMWAKQECSDSSWVDDSADGYIDC